MARSVRWWRGRGRGRRKRAWSSRGRGNEGGREGGWEGGRVGEVQGGRARARGRKRQTPCACVRAECASVRAGKEKERRRGCGEAAARCRRRARVHAREAGTMIELVGALGFLRNSTHTQRPAQSARATFRRAGPAAPGAPAVLQARAGGGIRGGMPGVPARTPGALGAHTHRAAHLGEAAGNFAPVAPHVAAAAAARARQ